ncbi:MAG: hypothetical protein AVDCRST_MAG32-1416, partial [uncultured Nocardioides sp.]
VPAELDRPPPRPDGPRDLGLGQRRRLPLGPRRRLHPRAGPRRAGVRRPDDRRHRARPRDGTHPVRRRDPRRSGRRGQDPDPAGLRHPRRLPARAGGRAGAASYRVPEVHDGHAAHPGPHGVRQAGDQAAGRGIGPDVHDLSDVLHGPALDGRLRQLRL